MGGHCPTWKKIIFPQININLYIFLECLKCFENLTYSVRSLLCNTPSFLLYCNLSLVSVRLFGFCEMIICSWHINIAKRSNQGTRIGIMITPE